MPRYRAYLLATVTCQGDATGVREGRLHDEQSTTGAADRVGEQIGTDPFGIHRHRDDLGAMASGDGDHACVGGTLDDHRLAGTDQRAHRDRQRGLPPGRHDHLRRVDSVDL
jgi:hypothetical protein